jgi:molybdate transport system substrate-binding protein
VGVKEKTMKRIALAAGALALSLAFALLSSSPAAGQAKEVHIVASAGVKPAVTALLPAVERTIGAHISTEFDASKTLTQKIVAGQAFDVAILTVENIDDLIHQGKIAASTRANLARTGVGFGIRAGAHKIDISTPETLKRTLLSAKSITLNPNGASTTILYKALDRLGITDEVKRKLILDTDLEHLRTNVVDGKSEMVVALISEIRASQGVEFAGPLPGELQSYVNFAAGVSTNSRNSEAAKTFVKFMTSPAAASVLKAKGLEPR